EVDGAVVVSHVKRDGLRIEEADKGCGENVLSGVLLHVVASSSGVDEAADFCAGLDFLWRCFEIVDDPAVPGVGYFGDFEFLVFGLDCAGVEDLASARRIEGGSVEEKSGARRVC